MITVEHLTKCYGDFLAVDDLSFEIEEGHVYGFLGPNGAGKSTTMNIITGCLSATSGRVRIDGHDIFEEPGAAKRLIGYLPEQPPLYLNETPVEYLRFVGEAKGLRGGALERQIAEVVEQTRLTGVRHRCISALSKGYRQRVGIAQALLGSPRVIILDEPTVGLDPLQIIGIRELIRQLGQTHTVLFSSHILSEVQTICDQILMIAHGKLAAFGAPDELESRLLTPNEITLTAEGTEEQVRALLDGIGAMLYNLQAAVSNFEYVLSFASLVFVVIVPVLTMRVLAEERRQKTDQLLYSLPITTVQIIAAISKLYNAAKGATDTGFNLDTYQLVDHDAYVAEFGCEPRNDGLKLPIVAAAFSGCHLEFVEKRAYDLNLNYFRKDGKLYVDCRRTLGLFLVFMP